MKNHFLLACLAAAPLVLASVGCSDDTSTGSGGGTTSTATGGGSGQGGDPTTTATTTGSGGAGGGGTPSLLDCTPPVGTVPALKLTPIVSSGLVYGPVGLKPAPDDPSRLYVWEEGGYIRVIENGQLLPTPFLDVSGLIRGGCVGCEEGLLGLAFHPDYATNGRFFIHYSDGPSGDSTIVEYTRSTTDPLVANVTPVRIVLKYTSAEANHNGGSLEFGPDGYLYIAFGDGGQQGDPGCDAQNLGTLLGKILRLDVDGTPDANGYPGAPGNPGGGKYYHVGFRNPWKITFDGCTGDLYIGDVGYNSREEVDVAPATGGPLNFGWPMREGTIAYASNDCVNPPTNLVEPIADYDHSNGAQAVTGGYVYRGSSMPGLRGTYFYADAYNSVISRLRWENGAVVDAPVYAGINAGGLVSFGQDGFGEMYVVELGGTISRIDPM